MSIKIDSTVLFEKNDIIPKIGIDLNVIEDMKNAFVAYSSKLSQMPPVMQILVPERDGQTCVKSAFIKGLPGYAVKVSSIFPQNSQTNTSVRNGLFLLFNSTTGAVDTILLDNGYLTQLRTAAAGAVATDLLANQNSDKLCIIGSGLQALMQAQAICLIRPITQITVWSRDALKGHEVCAKIHHKTGVRCDFESQLEDAVTGADIVVTTTASKTPLLLSKHIKPGQHITAMGSDTPGKMELDPKILAQASIYACDSIVQCEKLGELQHIDPSKHLVQPVEIGDIISHKSQARKSANDITIADLTGIGTQDTHIALLARRILSPDRKWLS